jgi:hypothetical protein
MNFSYEEIFSMYGQFDTFVRVEFDHDSESYSIFGESLMGTFFYSLEERRELKRVLQSGSIPRTNKHVRFVPSELEKLSDDKIELLDKRGLLNADIVGVMSSTLPRQNRFEIKGEKDIPNTIQLKFDSSDVDQILFRIGYYRSRLSNNHKLIAEEEYELLGYHSFLHPEAYVGEVEKKALTDPQSGKVNEGIRFYQLKAKFIKADLNAEEQKELQEISSRRNKVRLELLKQELQRSTERLKDLAIQHRDTLMRLIAICIQFTDEVLLPHEIPIWWDFERFLHIYVRHVKDTKLGERFTDRTIFQYKFRDIKRIIGAVIKSVYSEIVQHFVEHPTENFRRIGTRSIYYDGNYYRVEIEPSGRLLTFHPYNDNEDRTDTPPLESMTSGSTG